MKVYRDNEGLKKLAKSVKGTENIHLGIRPYGYHAGNALATLIYPYLLCELLEKRGLTAKFNFIISINDYEQDRLTGPEYHKYPFNIHPENTIIKYLTEKKDGKEVLVSENWVPIIKESINLLKKDFPKITIKYVKNSEIKNNPYFRKLLLRTIKKPLEQLLIYKKATPRKVLESPIMYGSVVCKNCHSANTHAFFEKNHILVRCNKCGSFIDGKYRDFDYWWYHKPLFIPRIKIFDMDISMSGGDHYNEGDVIFRRELIKLFDPSLKEPKYFFSPTLLSVDGRKMSKSLKNDKFAKLDALLEFARKNINYSFTATDDLIFNNNDEKEYINHLKSVRLRSNR